MLPLWFRIWIRGLAVAGAVFAVVVGLAPHLVFGSESYRTVARLPMALLAGAALAVSGSLALAVSRNNRDELHASIRTTLLWMILVPPALTYNIGALDGLKECYGVTAFGLMGLLILGAGGPLLAALLVTRSPQERPLNPASTEGSS